MWIQFLAAGHYLLCPVCTQKRTILRPRIQELPPLPDIPRSFEEDSASDWVAVDQYFLQCTASIEQDMCGTS
jgi:hypothetical protein